MRGTVLPSPSPEVGRDREAKPNAGGAVRSAVSMFELPHPDRCAVVPPHDGEGERQCIVSAARAWLGTPYRHQASVKGQGADCLGLVRGVWREFVGEEPEVLPPYSPDWAEVGSAETLLEAASRWLVAVPIAEMRVGDVLLFRMSPGCAVKHCAILSHAGAPEPKMIHAYWGRAVVESWMGPWWTKRLAAVFRFPEEG